MQVRSQGTVDRSTWHDFNTTYKLTTNQQVDVPGGVGLSALAADYFIGIGYSFRFSLYRSRQSPQIRAYGQRSCIGYP